MVSIFDILKQLYTNPSSDWILSLEDKHIQPFIIQRWLGMNNNLRSEVRWLDKYIFNLTPKQYLSMAWSCIPKMGKMPFIKYIKKEKKVDNLNFIVPKVKEYFDMDDNNWKFNEDNIRNEIKKNTADWFRFFGNRKYFWNKFNIDFNKIKG